MNSGFSDDMFISGSCWLYRSDLDRRFWHAWINNVHTVWNWVVDDFGNLVNPEFAS